MPRSGRSPRQRAHGPSTRRYLDFFIAGGAVPFCFVTFFEAFLADIVSAVIVCGIFRVVDPVGLRLIDTSDVANYMRRDLAKGILTEQTGLDIDAWKTIALRGKACDLLVSQAYADRQAFKTLGLFHLPPE